mgnify:CR=1 FL=1
MYNNSNSPARAVVIAAAAILLFLLCAIQLVRLQIVNGKEYRKISEDKLYVSMTVKPLAEKYPTVTAAHLWVTEPVFLCRFGIRA